MGWDGEGGLFQQPQTMALGFGVSNNTFTKAQSGNFVLTQLHTIEEVRL